MEKEKPNLIIGLFDGRIVIYDQNKRPHAIISYGEDGIGISFGDIEYPKKKR